DRVPAGEHAARRLPRQRSRAAGTAVNLSGRSGDQRRGVSQAQGFRMSRRWLAALGIGFAVTAGAAQAEVLGSAFTQLDAKKCRHTPGREEEDYGFWRCQGHAGIAVRLAAGDQRMYVSFGRKAADEPAASETFPSFNDAYKGTIEWRLEKLPNGTM